MSIFGRIIGRSDTPKVASVPETVPPTTPEPAPVPQPSFTLPEIDPDDPDFEEKQAVHEAYTQLSQILADAAPHIDYEKEYQKLRETTAQRPERRAPNPLSAFAIGMGAGEQGLNRMQATEDTRLSDAEKKWSDIVAIQEQAIKGDIQQKLEQGKFKQALAQSEALARLQSTTTRIEEGRKHKQKLAEIEKQNEGKIAVANIKAAEARSRLQIRLQNLADTYKIEGDIRKEFFKSMFRTLGTRMVQQDITGDPVVSGDDLDAVMGQAVDWAEEHSGIDFNTPHQRPSILSGGTTKSPAPAGETPEQKALREIREANKSKK